MDPKWCQNVTQDGSFHGTKDGVCGYLLDRGMFGRTDGRTNGPPPPYIAQNGFNRPTPIKSTLYFGRFLDEFQEAHLIKSKPY